jgi:hypothetical protein
MKTYFEALYHLLLFKTYTTMSRTLEIAYGVVAWLLVGLIVWAILK